MNTNTMYNNKYDSQGNKIEIWQPIKNILEIQDNEWLYYIADKYFGKVIKIEKNQLYLHIQNFRIPSSAYIAKIEDVSKLERPLHYIFIDWQIQEMFSLLYTNLEKSFIIWKKLEPFILSCEREKRKSITPEPFQQCGKILGKWMACGYLNKTEIEVLQLDKFTQKISLWQKIELLANDDSIDDGTIHLIDKIRDLNFAQAVKLFEQDKLVLWQWATIKAGFYHPLIELAAFLE